MVKRRGKDKRKRKRRKKALAITGGSLAVAGLGLYSLSRLNKGITIKPTPGRKPNPRRGTNKNRSSNTPRRLPASGFMIKRDNKFIKRGKVVDGVMTNSHDTMVISSTQAKKRESILDALRRSVPLNLPRRK